MNGLPCTLNGAPGTATLVYDSNGVATITCVPTTTTTVTTVPVDGFNNTFGTAHAIGQIACGEIVTKNGTTSPAGSEDWFEAGINCSPG